MKAGGCFARIFCYSAAAGMGFGSCPVSTFIHIQWPLEQETILKKTHLLCIGRVYLDISAIVDEMPEGDTKVFAEQSIYQIGGNAVNAALCAAKLGGETIRVHVHAAVGDDFIGRVK